VTILVACTSSIDNYASLSDSLGPRFVYMRMGTRDRETKQAVTRRALTAKDSDAAPHREMAQLYAEGLVNQAQKVVENVEVSEDLTQTIEKAAQVVCWGRASVPREATGQRDVCGIPEVEESPRVAKQLHTFARCLLAMGLTEDEATALVCRVAVDTMPAMRERAMSELVRATGPISSADVEKRMGCSWKTANRALEDFEALGLIEHGEVNLWLGAGAAQSQPWTFEHEDADVIRDVFAKRAHPIMGSATPT
jgi:hypothetical protein